MSRDIHKPIKTCAHLSLKIITNYCKNSNSWQVQKQSGMVLRHASDIEVLANAKHLYWKVLNADF